MGSKILRISFIEISEDGIGTVTTVGNFLWEPTSKPTPFLGEGVSWFTHLAELVSNIH